MIRARMRVDVSFANFNTKPRCQQNLVLIFTVSLW